MRHQESKSKKRSAVLAGLLVLVMLLTGTWAWQNFTQRAFNPAYGSSNNGGRLHNDYDGYDTGTHNQDIYAENFGDNDLFVRVQLREYLALGGVPVGASPSDIEISNPSTWPIYNSDAGDVATRRPDTDAALIGDEGISLNFGGSKVFMPTFNQATHLVEGFDPSVPALYQHLTAYRMTNATGRSIDAIASAFDIGTVNSVPYMIEIGAQTGPGTTDGAASVGNGGHDDWYHGQTFEAPVLIVDDSGILNRTGPYVHTAQSTLEPTEINQNGVNVTNGVMTLTQWREADRPTGNFWVLDTENEGGWFYWASPLPPGQATSLLLTGLTINEHSEDWEYIITPTADFVTRGNIDELLNLSPDAREIWKTGLGLPIAAVGCMPQTSHHPTNLWTDSTGVEWCVVDTVGDYSMLVSRYAHRLPAQGGLTEDQANRNHDTNIFVSWPDATDITGGPEIRKRVNTWFNNTENVSRELRDSAVHATLPNLNDAITGHEFHNRSTDEMALSQPLAETSDGLPFFLSPADLNVRLGNSPGQRQTFASSGATVSRYWLRSAGNTNNTPQAIVGNSGAWTGVIADGEIATNGVRPAIWVRR